MYSTAVSSSTRRLYDTCGAVFLLFASPSLARQEAEGTTRSGQALAAELHTLGRQNTALQQQVTSLQAQLEEILAGRQAEVRLLKVLA